MDLVSIETREENEFVKQRMINGLIRFHNSFPGLETIYTDQGTNFTGAHGEIMKAVDAFNSEEINESLRVRGIVWKWSPPRCPHYGGVWERLVRSCKRCLKFLLDKENLELDTFETLLSQVAYIMNTRPLLPV